MSEIELKARQLLAAEYERIGNHNAASDARRGLYQPEIAAVVSALAPQWQGIESAPKTTRSILVWCPERQSQYMVYWDGRYEGEWRTAGGGTVLTESPTKWQPLPAPPEVEG